MDSEKSYAFWKFLILNFLSVATTIIAVGYLFYLNTPVAIRDEVIPYILITSLFLLLFFFGLSFYLAKSAIKPLEDAIQKLDTFTKDFIHDLNTPITSMKLNVKLLKKDSKLENINALNRVEKSLREVSELHQNLNMLLQEETFMLESFELSYLVYNVVQTQQQLYPNIHWFFECQNIQVYSNTRALKQILNNLLSNACKYNSEEAEVTLKCHDNLLIIEDSGIGIQNPEKIFQREYKETQQGNGIGLDIVKRLCDALNIEVYAEPLDKGSRFTLKFKNK